MFSKENKIVNLYSNCKSNKSTLSYGKKEAHRNLTTSHSILYTFNDYYY